MATPIKLKRSAVEGKRPGLSDLQLGELALNTNDGNIFVERDTGGVGIATTIANVTPWTENYGGESIYYNDKVGIGTTNPQGDLQIGTGVTVYGNSGIVSATKFYGDASTLSNIGGTLAISGDYGAGAGVALLTQTLSIVGTTNEIETNADDQQVTIGLPNNVTISNDLIVGSGVSIAGITTVGFLTATNDISVSGVITATKFVKSGGTSSQFLKANGDIDDSTYLTEPSTLDDVLGRGNVSGIGISVGVSTLGNVSDGFVELYHGSNLVFQTVGTGVSIANAGLNTATIYGPEEIHIDPSPIGVGTTSGIVRIKGDLYVDGTEFIVNSETITLGDFVVGIATTATTDALTDGAGIGIGSIGDEKTFKYYYNFGTNTSLKSSENLNVASGKGYQIDQTEVLSATTLGSGVTESSLTSVGILTTLDVNGHTELNTVNVSGASTFLSNVKLGDDVELGLGSGSDLRLYHTGTIGGGTTSYIDNYQGPLYIRNNVDNDDGSNIIIEAKSGKASAVFQDDEGVRLYFNNVEKFATTNEGINVTGIATATTFSGSGASLTSIPNTALDHKSVSYGGVEVDLGSTDATPAFDLTDATNYPYTSLTGIVTHIIGDTTPQLGGDLDGNSKSIDSIKNLKVTGITTVGFATATDVWVSGAVTATTFDGSLLTTNLSGTISNDQLLHSSVNYGGITLSLGSTDATPAFDLTDATNYPYTSLTGIVTHIVGDTTPQLGGNLDGNSKDIYGVGIITATTFSGSGASLTSIPNTALDHKSVSYGGVSVDLGSTDATPAFDLQHATNYPYTSLTGIVTHIIGDTTPQLGGDLDGNSKNISGINSVTATNFYGSLLTTNLSGTITNAQLAGSIDITKLANYTVNYGGVSLDLGVADLTPAFDLTDATNYPYTSLTGIVTHIVGDTTPQLGGNLDGNSKDIYGVGILTATQIADSNGSVGSASSVLSSTGSGLSWVAQSGGGGAGGVVIKHDDSSIGTAGTINFSTNLDVTALSAGIVTVTASGGAAGLWQQTDVGINTSSKVGIGTTNPAYTLDFGVGTASTIRLVSDHDGTAIRMGAGDLNHNFTLIRVDGADTNHHGESNDSAYGFSLKYMGLRSGNNNSLSLFADNQAGTQFEAITVLQDGKVGIGSVTPQGKLDVFANNTDISGLIHVTQDGTGDAAIDFQLKGTREYTLGIDNSDGDKFKLSSTAGLGSNDLITVTPGGNVGIGTNAPISSNALTDNEAVLAVGVVTANTSYTDMLKVGTGITATAGIITADIIHLTGGTYDTGINTESDTAIVVGENFHIYNLETAGGYLRTLIEKTDGAIAVGHKDTSTVSKVSLYPGKDGSVELWGGDPTGGWSSGLRLNTTTTGVVVSGILTATSLVKSGGTSTQFLKADGSVDTSTYLTAETDTLDDVLGRGNSSTKGMNVGISTLGNVSSGFVELYNNSNLVFQTTGIGVSVASGTAKTAYIEGPSEIWIDPHPPGGGENSGIVRIKGDLYVDGTEFIVDVDKIELGDFQIGIATTAGTNALLDGAGIGIGAESIRKTITWNNATSALMSSENWNLASGKHYEIADTDVLTSTTLGSGVVNSSLTSVGTLGSIKVTGISTFSDNTIIGGSLTVGDDSAITGGSPTDQGSLAVYGTGKNSLIIQATTNGSSRGMAFRNTGDAYVSYISAENVGGNLVDLVFGVSDGTETSVDDVEERMRITKDGNVGINSTIPGTRLDIVDSSASRNWTPTSSVVSMFERSGGSVISLVSGTSASCGIDFGDSTDDNRGYIRYDHSDNSMFFRTDADEQLRITSDGKVGIGTDNPDQQLHIQAATPSILVEGTNTSSGDIVAGVDVRSQYYRKAGYSISASHDDGEDIFIGRPYASGSGAEPLVFDFQGTERLRITSDGDVGIGTNAPTGAAAITNNEAVLAVGIVTANTVYGTTEIVAQTFSAHDPIGGSNNQTRDKYRVWNSSAYTIGMKSSFTFGALGGDGGGSDGYAMTFQMSNTATRGFWWGDSSQSDAQGAMSLNTIGELVVAKSIRAGGGESDLLLPRKPLDIVGDGIISGDVGIGLTNPSSKLQVADGHINLSAGYSLQWGDTYERIEQSDGKIEFFTNNGEKMTLSGDNLGIGTVTPQGNVNIHGSANDDVKLYFTTPIKTKTRIGYLGLSNRFGMDVENGFQIRDAADSYATRLLFSSTGALCFSDTADNSADGYGTSGQVLTSNGDAPPTWQAAGGGGSSKWTTVSGGIHPATIGDNIGIGTTAVSDATLTVDVGTASTAVVVQGSEGQLFSVTNSLSSGSIFSVNDISGIPSIDVDADGTIQLSPYSTTEYIGLGITNPSSKLHVVGGTKITGVLTTGQIADDSGSVGTAASVLSSTGSGLSWVAQSGGTPTDITVANEASDATCFPLFVTAATGDLGPKSNAALTFDSTNGTLGATDFNSTSDIRLKTNIKPIDDPLAKVIQIEGVSFNWKQDNRPALGVIADQVQEIIPELVRGDDPKMVNYNGLVGLLIEAVKEQQTQIDNLNERLSKLE